LDLPPELRNAVYDLYFKDGGNFGPRSSAFGLSNNDEESSSEDGESDDSNGNEESSCDSYKSDDITNETDYISRTAHITYDANANKFIGRHNHEFWSDYECNPTYIIINPGDYLHSPNLHMLSLTFKLILQETWGLIYPTGTEVFVQIHIRNMDLSALYNGPGIFATLRNYCKIQFTVTQQWCCMG
jgi:hypothetical protein